MLQSEFIKQYCKNSGYTEKRLNKLGVFAIPCECGEKGCNGWAMITKETIKDHVFVFLDLDVKPTKLMKNLPPDVNRPYIKHFMKTLKKLINEEKTS